MSLKFTASNDTNNSNIALSLSAYTVHKHQAQQ